MAGQNKVVLAFSGGLDTSYCALYLKHERGFDVTTVTVDTGGFSADELADIKARALECGASDHILHDAKQHVYDDFISYIIKGNILRGGVYPLSVAAERIAQASAVVNIARDLGAQAVAHGSTGAGNDQIRFDATIHVLAPGLDIIAPIREQNLTRQQSTDYLKKREIAVAVSTTTYSINAGLWGTTIGGKETHDSWAYPPEDAFTMTKSIDDAPDKGEEIEIEFEQGMPVSLNGKKIAGPALIQELNKLGGSHGIGRGIHVGDTILGIKGRIAFEAPAPQIVIAAHRELEKITLGKHQVFWKQQLAEVYGNMLHEGDYFDPVMRDLECFINSTQETVTGKVRVMLQKGNIIVRGTQSPFSMFAPDLATYGEENAFWDGSDAAGFAKIKSVQAILARAARKH